MGPHNRTTVFWGCIGFIILANYHFFLSRCLGPNVWVLPKMRARLYTRNYANPHLTDGSLGRRDFFYMGIICPCFLATTSKLSWGPAKGTPRCRIGLRGMSWEAHSLPRLTQQSGAMRSCYFAALTHPLLNPEHWNLNPNLLMLPVLASAQRPLSLNACTSA